MGNRWMAALACAVCLLPGAPVLSGASPGAPGDAGAAAARGAAARSLAFIQREGQNWIDRQGCVSCHQVPFMVWSLNAAAAGGLAVDAAKLRGWNAWAADYAHFAAPNRRAGLDREKTLADNVDTVSQLLLGGGLPAGGDPGQAGFFRAALLRAQQPEGHWLPRGQLPDQKRPRRETQEVTTMWALLALDGAGAGGEQPAAALRRAREWIGTGTQGESTEWWAARLLLERAGGGREAAESALEGLLRLQRPDGGWGWLAAEESDAFGTGVALYALAGEKGEPARAAAARARGFLAATQRPDGSWAVKGTKTKRREHVDATSVYWGTCWAAIGLLESLPRE